MRYLSSKQFESEDREKKTDEVNKEATKEAKNNGYLCVLCGDIDTEYTGKLSPWWNVGTANKGGKYRCHRGCHLKCQYQQRQVQKSRDLCAEFKTMIEKYIQWSQSVVDNENEESDNSSQEEDDDVTLTEN